MLLLWRKRTSKLILGLLLGVFTIVVLQWSRTPAILGGGEKLEHQQQQHTISLTCIGQVPEGPQIKPQANSKSNAKVTSCSVGYVPQPGGDHACVLCPQGKFSLSKWIACEPLLDCEHIRHETTKGELLHSLIHWRYFKADWKGYEIIYAMFNQMAKISINYSRIQLFSPSHIFLYPIGSCEEEKVILFASNTTYISTGNHLDELLAKKPACNTCMVRFHMVLSYVRILFHLHAAGAVFCRSRTLSELLSQLLITEDFTLVMATLDNLPSDTSELIVCQQSELTGKFVAPEQKWPYGSVKIFNLKEQPKYDRMSDIWKVPEVVSFFLKGSCDDLLDYLQAVHWRCKSVSPHERPSADKLVLEYESVWRLLFSSAKSMLAQ